MLRAARAGDPSAAHRRKNLRDTAEQDYQQDVVLKGAYATRLFWVMVIQLAVADVVFVLHAWWGANWNVDASVMHVWLGATVVEVIGIVLVVTRYLFPRRDRTDA